MAAHLADGLFTLLAERAVDVEVAREQIVGRRQMVNLEQLRDLPLEEVVVDVEHSLGELPRLDRNEEVGLAPVSGGILGDDLRAGGRS